MHKFFLIISFFAANICWVTAQKIDYEKLTQIRNVTVVTEDSLIKAKVWNKNPKTKTSRKTDYYWYYNDQINHNQGGFSGKLLTGKYAVFNLKNQLITEGEFNTGVMVDIWKFWYNNGKLKTAVTYRKGQLHGTMFFYSFEGKLTRQVECKRGLKDGKEFIYLSDTIIVNRYHADKLIIKKKKEKPAKTLTPKPTKIKNEASKKSKEKKSSERVSKKETKPKENWIKRIFKRKGKNLESNKRE